MYYIIENVKENATCCLLGTIIGNTRASENDLRQQIIHRNHKNIFSQKVTVHSQKSQKFKQQTIQTDFKKNKQLMKVQPLSCQFTNCPNKVTELYCKPLDTCYFLTNYVWLKRSCSCFLQPTQLDGRSFCKFKDALWPGLVCVVKQSLFFLEKKERL